MVYRFRVTYEDHEEVFRDIDIKSSQSFTDLHGAIQQAIAFDNSKPATFYMSDDFWRKEEMIVAVNVPEEKKKGKKSPGEEPPPKKKTIADQVNHPHQHFVYVFDPEKEWTFNLELLKILPDDPKVQYPVCIKTSGTAPKQYKETNLPPPPVEDDDDLKKLKLDKDDLTEAIVEEKIVTDEDDEALPPLDESEEAKEETEEGEPDADTEPGESGDADFGFDEDDNP